MNNHQDFQNSEIAQILGLALLKSAAEPWFNLVLVVDESMSMIIWQRTVVEFQHLLENCGVFRHVQTCGIVTDSEGGIQIRPEIGEAACNQPTYSHEKLIDSSGRSLILVATDCVSSFWRSNAIQPALKAWGQNGPMAIVQMLPERMWDRTALGLGASVQFRASAAGIPNQQLIVGGLPDWLDVNVETAAKVPVITLEPKVLAFWAQLVSGKNDIWFPGFLWEPILNKDVDQPDNPVADLSAKQRVQRFRVVTSPIARKLAGLLAASPAINLPVVRFIQDKLLPESKPFHVAEVFLGGLLDKPSTEIPPGTDPDSVQFDFRGGVRDILLESVPMSISAEVLDKVSKFIACN